MTSPNHLFPKAFSSYEHTVLLEERTPPAEKSSQATLEQHNDLLGLIQSWVTDDKHSVSLCAALADDSEEVVGVSLILERDSKAIHAVYLTYAEVEEVYNSVPRLNEFASLTKGSEDYLSNQHYIELNDHNLSKALGFSPDDFYNNHLTQNLLSPTQALHYCLCYALSGTGEATISLMSRETLYDLEIEEARFLEKPLFFVSLRYVWPEKTKGGQLAICEMLYFQGDD